MLTRVKITECIESFSHNTATTPEIRQSLRNQDLKFTKRDLNKLLYRMKQDGELESNNRVPPYWRVIKHNDNNNDEIIIEDSEEETRTYVLIDCDSRPHCFKNAANCATKDLRIVGFCNPTYNFWKPKTGKTIYCKLLAAEQNMKNSSKFAMCLFIADKCHKHKSDIEFIVVSADKSIHTLAQVVHNRYHCIITATNGVWENLKFDLE